jgi:XTP/dITP diphosphohydrolase
MKRKKTSSTIPAPSLSDLLEIMTRLRAPDGCPWDREQDHQTLRFHAVEEVYELLDAIEAGDDHEMMEELGDLLLQVVFHCQLGKERRAFDFESVCRMIADKLIRRHPHVFGDAKVDTVDGVWTQWEQIKHAEKKGTRHERPSVFDGIPAHLPALMRAEKIVKKARKSGQTKKALSEPGHRPRTRQSLGRELFALAEYAQRKGWCAEDLLRTEVKRQETKLRRREKK